MAAEGEHGPARKLELSQKLLAHLKAQAEKASTPKTKAAFVSMARAQEAIVKVRREQA